MDQYKKDVQKLTEIKSQDSVQPQITDLLTRTEQIHQTYQTQERKWNEQVNLLKKKFAKDIDSKEVCNIRDTFFKLIKVFMEQFLEGKVPLRHLLNACKISVYVLAEICSH